LPYTVSNQSLSYSVAREQCIADHGRFRALERIVGCVRRTAKADGDYQPSHSSVSRYETERSGKSRSVPKLYEDPSFVSVKDVNGEMLTGSPPGRVMLENCA
jgi:hypothetical protein